jgi:MoaA/NifB/PqqE/SkfB family radical SAM enzyme
MSTRKIKSLHLYGSHLLRRSPAPFSLVHFVTNQCNLRCRHCFIYGESTGRCKDPRYSGEALSLSEIEALAKSLEGRLGTVSLTGGEPFLRPDLLQIAQAYSQKAGVRLIALSTNGYLTDKIRPFIGGFLETTDSHLYLMLSFDGPEAAHDENRGCPGAFKRALETARRLLERREPRIQVAATIAVFDQDADEMAALLRELVEDTGIGAVTTAVLRGAPLHSGGMTLNLQTLHRLNDMIRSYTVEGRLKPFQNFIAPDFLNARGILSRRRVEETCRTNRYLAPCTAGRVVAVVHADGSVYPCEMRDDRMGMLRDFNMNLPALMKSPQARTIQKAIVRQKCFCTWECAWSMNVIFEPRNHAALLSEYAKLKLARWKRK